MKHTKVVTFCSFKGRMSHCRISLDKQLLCRRARWQGRAFLRDQVLYYKADSDDRERLVVPQGLREQVLKLGHSIPWAGHLGSKKTLDRIASRFYWPGLSTQVHECCQSCSICQLTGDRRVPKFPLQPLPVIDVPFSQIAMDIVGPSEQTQSGHRYILCTL